MLKKLRLKMMIQEFIPGDDGQGVNYNSYFVDGRPIAEFTAQKVRIDPPFFGSPRVLVSKDIPEIIEPGRLLLKRLGYSGFSCMEFKRDERDGIFKLMEINCRANKTGSLDVYCGINFPWIQYKHLVFGEIEQQKNRGFKENVYWIDAAKDMVMFFTARKDEGYSLKEYVKPYLGEKVFGILSLKDPIPFLKRCVNIGRTAVGDMFFRTRQQKILESQNRVKRRDQGSSRLRTLGNSVIDQKLEIEQRESA
jgi:predicted ATP-grasp superfamily ATP-dependent carboligase